MGRRLGLLIGINQYQDRTFQPLRFAESDAILLARWLGDERGGRWPSSEIYTLTGAGAITEQVESLLVKLCKDAAEHDDLVFIYFAGHAFIAETSGEGYLTCANTFYRNPASAIHLPGFITQAMAPSPAAQVVFFLDCFQTGPLWSAQRAIPFDFRPLIGQPALQVLQQAQGRILYCSCRGNDLTPESSEQGCGSFLYRTIVGLSGRAADTKTGTVTLQRLHPFLTGVLSPQHQPQPFGQDARPIVLVGAMPEYASVASSLSAAGYAAASPPPPAAHSAPQAGQVTFQGIDEGLSLLSPETPRAATTGSTTGQLASSTSGPISISQVEQNYQQQCIKLMQQARQQIAAQNLPGALQSVEQALRMAPTYPDALTLKVQILGTAGQYVEAIATNEQLLQLEPANALAWSMYAALLINTGRLQEALTALERTLALQPGNADALAMQQTIQSRLLAQQSWTPPEEQLPSYYEARPPARESFKSFLGGAALQLLAFIVGLLGAALLVYQPKLPTIAGFLLESFGLAALCTLAARGSFLYGFSRVFLTILLSLASIGLLGGLYKFQYASLLNKIVAAPSLLVSVLFLAGWLVVAAVLPLLLSFGGFILGVAMGVRRKR
jgi:tetratricopeptide (TPR) repeat protein